MKLLLIIFIFYTSTIKTEGNLKMVIEVFRHGARGPLFDYWNSKKEWP